MILIPGADAALDAGTALDDTAPDDVVLIQLDVPPAVVADVLREADRRQLRVVVNASPYATVDPEAAALADPFVVGEQDAALLADVGVMPRSLLRDLRAGRRGLGRAPDGQRRPRLARARARRDRGVLRDAGRRARRRVATAPRRCGRPWLPPGNVEERPRRNPSPGRVHHHRDGLPGHPGERDGRLRRTAQPQLAA